MNKPLRLKISLYISCIVTLSLLRIDAFSETPVSGIFIIHTAVNKHSCERELKMMIGSKRVCILNQPIVAIDQFEYITDILYDPVIKINYIELGLSSASIHTLNHTIAYLPKAEFAVVINNSIICIFSVHEKLERRYIRIGEDLDSRGLQRIHDAFKNIKF